MKVKSPTKKLVERSLMSLLWQLFVEPYCEEKNFNSLLVSLLKEIENTAIISTNKQDQNPKKKIIRKISLKKVCSQTFSRKKDFLSFITLFVYFLDNLPLLSFVSLAYYFSFKT